MMLTVHYFYVTGHMSGDGAGLDMHVVRLLVRDGMIITTRVESCVRI